MLETKGISNGEYLEYKGRPLVRKDDEIYYGDLSADYHTYMLIMKEKPSNTEGVNIPATIMLQLKKKDGSIEKQTLSKTLTDALDTAAAWLERH